MFDISCTAAAAFLGHCANELNNHQTLFTFAAVCHPGADAGAHVPTQGVRAQPQGLSQNHALPKVAEDGRAPW